MQALILDEDSTRQTNLSVALMTRGFHVLNAQNNATGIAYARRGGLDLLVMSERVQDALTHSVALSAERHSPYVATIMLTPRRDDDLAELHDLLPSLYSILGEDMSVDLVAELGIAGVTGATCHTASERLLLLPCGAHIPTGNAQPEPEPVSEPMSELVFAPEPVPEPVRPIQTRDAEPPSLLELALSLPALELPELDARNPISQYPTPAESEPMHDPTTEARGDEPPRTAETEASSKLGTWIFSSTHRTPPTQAAVAAQ